MSLSIDRDWIPERRLWVDISRLKCDLCGAQTRWGELCDITEGWDHLLGLDCCPACTEAFYESVR